MPGFRSTNVLQDFRASIVVFLVALPLAMGVSLASGLPPSAGLISSIIGGLIVGTLSGAPLQVSGAAAGLTVIMFGLVQRYTLPEVGAIVFAAGVIQVAAGALRVGSWFRAVSPAVIYGMLSGIGILIFSSQFHALFDKTPAGDGLANLAAIPETIATAITAGSTSIHAAISLGLVSLAVLFAWPRLPIPAKLKKIPAALLAVLVAATAAYAFSLPVQLVEIPRNFVDGLVLVTPEALRALTLPEVLADALQLAAIASAESLLCVTAVDQMHRGKPANYNKEMFAQGVGNTCCGIVGGLPLTGVIVRSSANVAAGAQSRLSTIFHGLWVLLFVTALPGLLNYIPKTALAAILVLTGINLLKPAKIKELYHKGLDEVMIYAATTGLIVSVDLLTGVLTGLGLALAKLLFQTTQLKIHPQSTESSGLVVKLQGAATFLRLPKLARFLETLDSQTHVRVATEDLHTMDHACLELLQNWKTRHENGGGRVELDFEPQTSKSHAARA